MSIATRLLKPASLTDCVFRNTSTGRIKHALWRVGLNPVRAVRAARMRFARDPEVDSTAHDLREEGIVIGDAPRFLTEDGLAALEACKQPIMERLGSDEVQQMLAEGRNADSGKDYLIRLVPFDEPHGPDSQFLRLALDTKLLRSVAAYFGLWPQLHAIGSWLNFPTGQESKKSQLWHRDPEDVKIVKVFIYLEPVTVEQGPFCFIRRTHPFGALCGTAPFHDHPRRITDEEMERSFSRDSWVECAGPASTMVLADTVGFHRGGNVRSGRRLLITFTYTSGTPQEPRHLRVTETPAWITEPIQAAAL